MCGITILIWHSGREDKQRHLVHHRVDLCEYRKDATICDACRSAYGEVDPGCHELDCPYRRHKGRVCDNISWWILEKSQDEGCPVCQENGRLPKTSSNSDDVIELNAKCDIYRYCQTLRGGPCPFLMVVPDDCRMGWSPEGEFQISD
jgi:hypothetical protein